MAPEFSEYPIGSEDVQMSHEAGFDAFMTGTLFFKLMSYTAGHKNNWEFPSSLGKELVSASVLKEKSDIVDEVRNRVPYFKS